ncbi:MAG: AbrB/MazE/SpoVT family DNA-binding domain-containing protein [Gammaproteobacteria bacterium]|jgi:antitoxin PrlF|nr:AbrB/MazE/SpoVT family DNA-binding domain-containing protein [Gammaproteobacteria bacterium]
MLFSSVTQKGQATIPVKIRNCLHLNPGDKIGFVIEHERVFLKKIEPFDYTYHQALTATLSEWDSAEDDDAYQDL